MSIPRKKAKQDKPDPRGKVYTLETSDGKRILAREKALKQCQLFETLLRKFSYMDFCDFNIFIILSAILGDSRVEDSIPVHDVGHRALKIVIEFCNNHMDEEEYIPPVNGNSFILDPKDVEIFEKLDSKIFEEVIKAANYVNNARCVDTALMYAVRAMDGLVRFVYYSTVL